MTQLLDWAVPWSPDELVNLVFLSIACALACAVPVVYAVYANLRDPLARAVLYGSGSAALALLTLVLANLAWHAGFAPDPSVWHWLIRLSALMVSTGVLLFLIALARVLKTREPRS